MLCLGFFIYVYIVLGQVSHIHVMSLNRPVLIAPRFGLDDSAHSDFDATLVLATMMSSQLHGADESTGQALDAANQNSAGPSTREGSQGRAASHDSTRRGNMTPGSAHRSDETAIWSDLSGLSRIP
jgi:cell cycle checkpoint control protein RAD9A